MLVEPGKHCRAREKATSSSRCASGISALANTLIYCMYDTRIIMNGVLPNEWFDAFSSIRWRSCDGFGEHSDSLTKVAWKHLVLWHSSAIRKAVSESAAEFLMGPRGKFLMGQRQTMLRPDLYLQQLFVLSFFLVCGVGLRCCSCIRWPSRHRTDT